MNDAGQPQKHGQIDFAHPYSGRIGNDEIAEKYKGKKIGFNGDYKVPIDLRDAIEEAGRVFLQYAEDHGINLVKFGFDINNDGKVTPQEAGSGCMAFALEHGKRSVPGKIRDEIISLFNDGKFTMKKALMGENWRAAEQVLGDNWPNMVSKPTNTEEADKAFVNKYNSTSNSTLIRGGDGGGRKF